MDLTDKEQQLLAFALFSTGLRVGPDVFETIESIATKLGIVDKLGMHAKDWLNYSKTVREADSRDVGLFQNPKKDDEVEP
jgi:hypothetical protein